ncbi:MAG: T9SS type A sorting domain-containing protein [Bacteroidales bacterium]|nr:T9SS type A sorting domain-containing protein [Bacteroidales bacterium]MCF8456580.1 T9SS type A sorting domain-containing protein [Bacteroidales bacterium]
MKNKLLKLLFTNLLVFGALFASVAQVTTYPYVQNFDAALGSWVISATSGTPISQYDSFEYGRATTNLWPYYKASSTDKYVKTDMEGLYGQNTYSWVVGPVFDFSGLIQPKLSLDIYADALYASGNQWAGAYIDYSLDGGSNWTRLGTQGVGTNWYNGAYSNFIPGVAGWGNCWVTTNGMWKTASLPLTFLAGQSNVIFKVVFRSTGTIEQGTGYGFGFDNVNVWENAPNNADPQVISWDGPQDQTCALSATQAVSVTVQNIGTTALTANWWMKLVVGATDYGYELITDDVAVGATYTYTFVATPDFSAAGMYDCTVSTSLDNSTDNDMLYHTVTTEGLIEINTFPKTFDFTSGQPVEFGFMDGTYSSLAVVGGEVVANGGNGSFWTGGSGSVTPQNAWVDNAEYMTKIYTCNVDPSGLGSLELIFDLYQEYQFSPDYNWFRVLVNGMPVQDVNGVVNFHPDTYEAPAYMEVRYDLSSYVTGDLTIELQTSTKYANDIVKIDNVILRQKLQYDLAISALLAPSSGCGLGMDQVVVEFDNLGTSPASLFSLRYQVGATVVTEAYPTAVLAGTHQYTFATPFDFSAGASVDISIVWGADQDNGNDMMTGIMVYNISDNLSTAYTQDFSDINNVVPHWNWAIQDGNNDGSTWFWNADISGNEVYSFDYEGFTANDYLYTNCFNLTAGQDYKICLDYATYLAGASKGLEVYLSTSQDASGIITPAIISMPSINTAGAYEFATNLFQVPTTGVYHIVFKATGAATLEAEYLFIDNIVVREFTKPDLEVTDLTLGGTSACTLGNIPVTIQVTSNSGSPLCTGEMIEVQYFVSFDNGGGSVVWAPVVEYFTTTAPFNSGDDFFYTFSQVIDMSTPGVYTVTPMVNYNFEGFTSNDVATSLALSLTHYGDPQGLAITTSADGYCDTEGTIEIGVSFTNPMGFIYSETLVASTVNQPYLDGSVWKYDIPSFNGTIIFTYTVEFTDPNAGCTSFVTKSILVTNPTVELGPTMFVEYDQLSNPVNYIDAGYGATYTYSWMPNGQTDQAILPTGYGQYFVTVTDGYCSVTDDVWVYQEQLIDLRMGWGLWSTLIDAASITPSIDMVDIATNGGLTDVIIFKDEDGATWWPVGTPPFDVNFIGDIVNGEGYQYKMGDDNVLSIKGLPVNPALTPIALTAGYNIVGYLRQEEAAVANQLAGIIGLVDIFKDEDGKVFWPAFNINLIGNLKPGKGYKVKVNANTTLSYLANGPSAKSAPVSTLDNQYYTDLSKSNNNLTLGIPVSAWSTLPLIGDEVGVFAADGQLVGTSVFEGSNMAIALFGDDDLTSEKDGLHVGETFTIKVWNQTTGVENTCEVIAWETGSDKYAVDGISVVKNVVVTNGTTDGQTVLYQNMPNPFSQATQIKFYLPEASQVNITVYNVIGKAVKELVSTNLGNGYHTVDFNAEDLASGTYFYKFVSDNYTETKYMSIEK